MRLWHQSLIPYLPRQQLLGQHRECCALRGNGWGRKHATVDYVFTHNPSYLVAYHSLVMDEMERRDYRPDKQWRIAEWRGNTLGMELNWASADIAEDQLHYSNKFNMMIYPEHNDEYLQECLDNLKSKNIIINIGRE